MDDVWLIFMYALLFNIVVMSLHAEYYKHDSQKHQHAKQASQKGKYFVQPILMQYFNSILFSILFNSYLVSNIGDNVHF
jgi:hypothetical protein